MERSFYRAGYTTRRHCILIRNTKMACNCLPIQAAGGGDDEQEDQTKIV
jgi:hypothetical protein